MLHLTISLLGTFLVTLDGAFVTGFESDKARALLAYLAVEAGHPLRREILSALLWPEMTESSARSNLRHTMAYLRRTIKDYNAKPPFLQITRQTVQFNQESNHSLDIATFNNCLIPLPPSNQPTLQKLTQAADLYRGDFLNGFSIADCAAFEEWTQLTRTRLRSQMVSVLHQLADTYARRGQYEKALSYARQRIELEPWDETGHQQLMRLFALNGQRCTALAQYETCRQLLAAELGIEPTAVTTNLYQRILAGQMEREPPVGSGRMRGYKLLGKIGAGSFGAVYRAVQPIVEREVAIKIILPQFANDPAFIQRFNNEAQIVARLEHPHIVPLYDYWRAPDGAYFVMRLLGGSLADLLAKGPCPLATAVTILDQITSALDIAHQQGIIHNDIKPANILLDKEQNAYLSDFSLAGGLFYDDPTISNDLALSSAAYISPECARGDPISPATDIYSLGIVLFEMLTGQHPFADTPTNLLKQKHIQERLPSIYPLRPDLPNSLDNIIQKATAKQPSSRFTDAFTIASAFRIATGI